MEKFTTARSQIVRLNSEYRHYTLNSPWNHIVDGESVFQARLQFKPSSTAAIHRMFNFGLSKSVTQQHVIFAIHSLGICSRSHAIALPFTFTQIAKLESGADLEDRW